MRSTVLFFLTLFIASGLCDCSNSQKIYNDKIYNNKIKTVNIGNGFGREVHIASPRMINVTLTENGSVNDKCINKIKCHLSSHIFWSFHDFQINVVSNDVVNDYMVITYNVECSGGWVTFAYIIIGLYVFSFLVLPFMLYDRYQKNKLINVDENNTREIRLSIDDEFLGPKKEKDGSGNVSEDIIPLLEEV